jgi:hypothetical protein
MAQLHFVAKKTTSLAIYKVSVSVVKPEEDQSLPPAGPIPTRHSVRLVTMTSLAFPLRFFRPT